MSIYRTIIALTLLVLLNAKATKACQCPWPGKADLHRYFQGRDYVVSGIAVKAISPDFIYRDTEDSKGGTQVLFVVEKCFKGDLNEGDTLAILQNMGSCDEFFYIGNSYLVFGDKIRELVDANSKDNLSSDSAPPPPFDAEKHQMAIRGDKETFNWHKSILEQYDALHTMQCLSYGIFTLKEEYKELFKWLREWSAETEKE